MQGFRGYSNGIKCQRSEEANEGNVSVRSRDGGELGSLSVEEFVEKLVAEAKDRI